MKTHISRVKVQYTLLITLKHFRLIYMFLIILKILEAREQMQGDYYPQNRNNGMPAHTAYYSIMHIRSAKFRTHKSIWHIIANTLLIPQLIRTILYIRVFVSIRWPHCFFFLLKDFI